MRELHGRLFKPVKNLGSGRDYPPIAQRPLQGRRDRRSPAQDYRLYPATMPETQAEAYELATTPSGGRRPRRGAQDAASHSRCFAHPEAPESTQGDMGIDSYFARSARFEAARNILGRIHERRERALIFTEDRRMQAFVAQWIRSEFGLYKVRIINGATPSRDASNTSRSSRGMWRTKTARRHDPVARAAGVGLTLTAATHVIHLSRWWNPAVEEQCNDRIYRIGQRRDVTVHLPLAIPPDLSGGLVRLRPERSDAAQDLARPRGAVAADRQRLRQRNARDRGQRCGAVRSGGA